MLERRSPGGAPDFFQRLLQADDVAIFGIDVEQVGLVRPGVPVANAIPDHDGSEAVLDRVDDGCADAAAGRAAGEYDRVDAIGMQHRREAGAEEGAGILLGDDQFARQRFDVGAEFGQRIAGDESRHHELMGHVIEPVIAPLGFNWKVGIGLISSVLAREVMVSTMGTLYGADPETQTMHLQTALHTDMTLGGAVALMIFFAFAMQCTSTMAVVRRETNSWKWPAIQFAYMLTLAWLGAFAVNHIVTALFG